MDSGAELGAVLAASRRHRLHGGSGVLYGGTNQVLSLCVASVRYRGQLMSLYRSSLVRGLARRCSRVRCFAKAIGRAPGTGNAKCLLWRLPTLATGSYGAT